MLDHGVPFSLTDRVRRIVAPNPGVMTGPGTNTYLLGNKEVAVVDPGPLESSHIDAILETAGDRIRWIVCTHTHPDHSPAWKAIADATGAETLGGETIHDMFQDTTFKPQRVLEHGDVLATDEFTLRAVHTPGHVGNHFCFFVEEDGMMIAGDHIMNGSTVVIIPPSGDMKLYIESLQLLLDYPLQSIAPGHGDLMEEPREVVEWLVNHRLQREAKVVDGLKQLGTSTLDELVKVVYDDVDTSLHKMAKLSLNAHLIKLGHDGRAVEHNAQESWELIQPG
jgi:glyoxylase-like metal-dependent hydrolase (beta-lactamase superfamily II)